MITKNFYLQPWTAAEEKNPRQSSQPLKKALQEIHISDAPLRDLKSFTVTHSSVTKKPAFPITRQVMQEASSMNWLMHMPYDGLIDTHTSSHTMA